LARRTNIDKALQRRREDLARAREQNSSAAGRQTTKLACKRPLAEQKPARQAVPSARTCDVVGELALQERRGVGAAGANHATIGEAANAPDREHVGHGPLSWCCPGFEGARVL
jgi:hypothetical protein